MLKNWQNYLFPLRRCQQNILHTERNREKEIDRERESKGERKIKSKWKLKLEIEREIEWERKRMREKGIYTKERECIVFIYEICRKTLAGTERDR